MEIKYKALGTDRKELVAAISEIIGVKSEYLKMPTRAYQIDYFTVDKNGNLLFDDRADSEEIENLIEQLAEKGFTAEHEENVGLTLGMPKSYFTENDLENLQNLVSSKATLIKKALGIEDLPIEIEEDRISFPWFDEISEVEEVKNAYTHLIYALCEMARNQKRVNAKEKEVENEKYAFRCFLLRLGFIGASYKEERKILLQNLEGSSAFKKGKEEE